MPPTRGQEEERDSGDDTSFSFPSFAAAREGADSGAGDGSDGGYSGWARRVMMTASEGRFGRRLRVGAWAKKFPGAESQTKGGSPGLWPPWGANRPPPNKASRQQQQRMARYRQEMMELFRDAPESAYELSLRDLVELPRTPDRKSATAGAEGQQGTTGEEEEKEKWKKGNAGMAKWQVWRSKSGRSGTLGWNTAFLPIVAGLSGWKKKIAGSTATAAKMSPKAVVHDEECEAGKKAAGDYGWGSRRRSKPKDWWVMGKSRSVRSGSSSGSESRRKRTGCNAWL